MKMNNYFIGKYQISKTLRNRLIPQGKTLENMEKRSVLQQDEQKKESYVRLKKVIDDYHKYYIATALAESTFDWFPLAQALETYQQNDDQENLGKQQEIMRKNIVHRLQSNGPVSYKEVLFNKKLITEVLPKFVEENRKRYGVDADVYLADLKLFSNFSTYFLGLHENRKNMYSSEKQGTAIGNRLVNENFSKHFRNVKAIADISAKAPEILQEVEKQLRFLLRDETLQEIFSISYYNQLLTQSGIDYVNSLIGGYTAADGTKYRGINEAVNLYLQQYKEKHLPKLESLYKQILSDQEKISFIPEQFADDAEVYQAVDSFWQVIGAGEKNCLHNLVHLIENIQPETADDIYLANGELPTISTQLLKQWDRLSNLLKEEKSKEIGSYTKKTNQKRIDAWLKTDMPVSLINLVCQAEVGTSGLQEYLTQGNRYLEQIAESRKIYENYEHQNEKLQENKEIAEVLKSFLDAIMRFFHYCKTFDAGKDFNRDGGFYEAFEQNYELLSKIIPLYNKVRNYVAQKPFSQEKFKLNFNCPTLLKGWSKSKENDNCCILLFKDGKYFLGIYEKTDKPNWQPLAEPQGEVYKKMNYYLLSGPNKMLPKCFFSQKGIQTYQPSAELLDKYKKGCHKKTGPFDLRFCHELIDFFKEKIALYPGWDVFDFHFSDTDSYEDISQFYREFSDQGYKITYEYLPSHQVDKAVEQGQIYLFEIYNKDFSPGSSGKPNLHTMYFKALFAPENLRDVVFKLSGEAEVFFRRKSIKTPFCHKTGEYKVNKTDVEGNPIADAVYMELCDWANGRKREESLSAEAKDYVADNRVRYSKVTHDIIKDRRYAFDQFFLHLPITINFKAESTGRINLAALEFLANNKDVHVIGIDRGERNLIYLTLINQRGEILKQKSFNIIGGQNYQAKLSEMERQRQEHRRSWQNIGNIKNLKEGYLSQVIHEITRLMVENNAVLIMEDLNFGFKRGRFKVERQVYQKFEKMLINKLNYLVFKEEDSIKPGGLYRGFQLTEKFESFQKMGRQNGMIFYVPAGYTSKIDPVTGFVSLFDFANAKRNLEQMLRFLTTFDNIVYLSGEDMFRFDFRYSNFGRKDAGRDEWSVYTNGKRIVYRRNEQNHWQAIDVCPTEQMKTILSKYEIPYQNGENIVNELKIMDADRKNSDLIKGLFFAFRDTVQMRNSNSETGDDYIVSPVKNQDGKFFDSREKVTSLPQDADANGAYHIALKGLILLNRISETYTPDKNFKKELLRITNAEWFDFVQNRN